MKRGLLVPLLSAVAVFAFGSAEASAQLFVIPPGDPSGLGFTTEVTTTQAGAHPDATTSFETGPPQSEEALNEHKGPFKDSVVDLPPGVIGNPEAADKCTTDKMNPGLIGITDCPHRAQVGVVRARINQAGLPAPLNLGGRVPLYAMRASADQLAVFAFKVLGTVVTLEASVRPSDYGIRLTARNTLQDQPVSGATVTVWGVPSDPSHDSLRCHQASFITNLCDFSDFNSNSSPFGNPGTRAAFFSNPTVCDGPKLTTIRVSSWWIEPVGVLTDPVSAASPTPTGCDQLEFVPTIDAKPTTNVADSPSGLDFNLHIPLNLDPDGLSTSHLKDAVVALPKGFTVNPSSANGLGACSEAQIAIGVDVPNSCPDSSKLGTVEIDTPVLEKPLLGAIYLAEQSKNPFNSLIALYIAARLPNGQEVKLPGRADTDPSTGQITATFKNNPQLPFEDLHVSLFGGAGGSLRTPVSCGSFTATSDLTPWASPSIPDAFPTSGFQITQGAGGGACVDAEDKAPNSPSFTAGTVDPTAGAFSPFALRLARADGSQPFKAIDTLLPKGLLAKLGGTPYCPDAALASAAAKSGKAEQASASCPAASEVGSVSVSAGAGPAPLNVGGKAYLAGPYKGAPLSLAVVTPAVAGPFDLGTVVVRAALNVDPVTAQVHAVSDEIPTILQGIPLDVRSISLSLAKPKFTLNPTSCDPMAITGSALSAFNQSAALSNRFQVGDCARLGFKPKLAIRLFGPTHRSGHPKLKATLTYPEGAYANIASAQVTLPKTEILDQAHIRTICTRVQYAAKACPPGSVYGYAKAWSPLLDQPLEGPVYLRSSSHELPDLVASLDGQIHVDLAGRIDSVNARIRNTFEAVPDAPVSKFVLTMQGAKKGLLVNNTELCKAKPKASASFLAQNGKEALLEPVVKVRCGKKGRRGKGRGR